MAFKYSAPEAILYQRPVEWPRVTVGSNEMAYLVSDLAPYTAFQIAKTGVGNTYVDWGDGVVESNSGSWVAEHVYSSGGVTVRSDKYPTYKVWVVRIYCDAGVTLTNARPYKNAVDAANKTFQTTIYGSVLEAYFGTNSNVTVGNWFSVSTNAGINCKYMRYIKLPSVYTATSLFQFFNTTTGTNTDLERIDLPTSMTSQFLSLTSMLLAHDNNYKLQKLVFPQDCVVTTAINAFQTTGLREVVLPPTNNTNINNWFTNARGLEVIDLSKHVGGVNTMQTTFQNCISAKKIILPSGLNFNNTNSLNASFQGCSSLYEMDLGSANITSSVTNLASMFVNCSSIETIVMPTGDTSGVTSIASMFNNCVNLLSLNLNNLGSTNTNQFDASAAFTNCTRLQTLSVPFRMSRFALNGGGATTKVDLSSLRFTNTGSTFAGTSPQINVSHTNLSTAALVTLFNDIAATATTSGKTINITGATGAAGLTAGDRAILTSRGWTITG